MSDLTNPALIKLKGILFLLLGALTAVLVVLERPTWKLGLLLALAIWSYCRFYYFAFYVIQHYVDPDYRFSGLFSFAGYMLGRRQSRIGKSN
jgi:hypothetical protein